VCGDSGMGARAVVPHSGDVIMFCMRFIDCTASAAGTRRAASGKGRADGGGTTATADSLLRCRL